MPPIDQNLISPLKVEPNDFQTREYAYNLQNYGTDRGTEAKAYNVKIGTVNSQKYLIKADQVIYDKVTEIITPQGVDKSGKPANIHIQAPLSILSNESEKLLSGPQIVSFRPGQNVSYHISNYDRFQSYGKLRVIPKTLEIRDEEIKLQAELDGFFIASYSYERRKRELKTLEDIVEKLKPSAEGFRRSNFENLFSAAELSIIANLIPGFRGVSMSYQAVYTALEKILKAERSQEILRSPTNNDFTFKPATAKTLEISVNSKGLNVPQQEEISLGKLTLPSYAQFNGSNEYLGFSPFFGSRVDLTDATAKVEKNSVGQDVVIIKGKGTGTNSLSDLLPSAISSLASDAFKISYDFSEPESYISIAPGETRYVGRVTLEGFIIPNLINIRKLSYLIDKTKSTYDILGEFGLPLAKDRIIGGRLKVVQGQLDAIAMKVDNLNVLIGKGVYLQRLEGGVSNLTRGGFPTINAGIGLTFGASINVDSITIPYVGKYINTGANLLLGAASVDNNLYIARADGNVGMDASRIAGWGDLKFLAGVLKTGRAAFSYNYKKQETAFRAELNLFSIANASVRGIVNGGGIDLIGSASVKVPEGVPWIGGHKIDDGFTFLKFTNDDDNSNDHLTVWYERGNLKLGGKFQFDGKFQGLDGNNIGPLRVFKDQAVNYVDKNLEEELKAVESPFKSPRLPLARTVEVSLPEAPAKEQPHDPALQGFGENAILENALVNSYDPADTLEEAGKIEQTVAEINAPSSDSTSGEQITPTPTDSTPTEEADAEIVPQDETATIAEDEEEAKLYDLEAGNNSEVTYGVTGGQYFMFTVSWENSAELGSVPFEVIGPDGTVYSSQSIPIAKSEAEYEQPWKVGIMGELSDDKQLTILVKEPEIGEWTLSMTDTDTLGALEYGGTLDAPDPTIRFNDLDFDPTTNNVNINYQAADPDSQATISFYYDKDGNGKDGTPISPELIESDGQGNFTWNAADIASGEYYIYAMLQDNDNAPRFVYAPNPVKIVEQGSLEQVKDVEASSVGDDTVLVSWEPVEGAVYYIVDYDDDAAGSKIDTVEDTTMVVYDDNAVISGLKTGETYRFTVAAVNEQGKVSFPMLPAIAKVGGGSLEDMAPDADEWSVYATPGTTYTETIEVPYKGSVTLLEAPRGVALNPTTGEFTWDVPTDAYGWYNVRVLQTDSSSETSVYDFDLFAGTPPEAEGDVEIGSVGNDNLTGNVDDDLLAAGAGDDQSAGGDGDDEMYGNGGDDQLMGEAGGDDMQGGQGNDSAFGGADNDFVDGDNGDDKLYGNVGEDELTGGQGNDEVRCGQDDDTAFGNEGSDQMYGDLGNDILAGGKNNDFLSGGAGDDEMYGGIGDDTISGDAGDDSLNGNADNDFTDGGEGNDEVSGGKGNDTLVGGAGDDNLYGDKGNDSLAGGDGNNFLQGSNEIAGPEIDTLIGGAGEDYFSLGEGIEPLYSAFGNDDYVLIQNFEFDKDSLLLPGNPNSYQFIDITAQSNLPSGIGLSYVNFKGEQDLVAILAGVSDTNAFTGNSLIFLENPPEPATT